MRRVAVVAESIACLPREDAVSPDIAVLPVSFEYAGRDCLDGVDTTPGEFDRMPRGELPLATTSAPSTGVYKEAFQESCAGRYEVICISPARAVAKMCETAVLGRRLVCEGAEESIEVSTPVRPRWARVSLVPKAARMAQEGAKMDKITRRMHNE